MKFRCTCKATFTQCNGLQDLPSYMTLGQEGALLANDQPLSMQATLDLGKKSASSQLLSVHHFSSDQTCLHTHTHTHTHAHECSVSGLAGHQQAASCTCHSQSRQLPLCTSCKMLFSCRIKKSETRQQNHFDQVLLLNCCHLAHAWLTLML